MWKFKAVLFPSLEKAINSFHPKDLTLINVRNLHSSYCDTDSPFQSSSVKPLPIHGIACNERIFHEVRVEIHTRMCTFCDGFLHQIIALPVLKASGSFLSFKLQLCGTDNNMFFQNNFIVLACLASEKKKKRRRKTFLHGRWSNCLLVHFSAKIISVSESHFIPVSP